jgi:hypothetical protein
MQPPQPYWGKQPRKRSKHITSPLRAVLNDRIIWACCTRCPYSRELHAEDLAKVPGLDTPLNQFVERLLCSKCGGRAMISCPPRTSAGPPPPLAAAPHPGVVEAPDRPTKPRYSDWERRHSRRKGWHKKYLDENGNPTHYRKDD